MRCWASAALPPLPAASNLPPSRSRQARVAPQPASVPEAAYRFVRHEPGVDVVLFGTGDAGHVRHNVDAILKPALPAADVRRLYDLFGHLEGVGLERPPWRVATDGKPAEIPGAS